MLYSKKTFKRIREELILTQEEFAKLLGLCTSSIQKWEWGMTYPHPKQIRKLIEVCNEHNIDINKL